MPLIRSQELTATEGMSPGLHVRMLVDAAGGSRSLTIGDLTVTPDSQIPQHIHPDTEEAMVILEGRLELVLGDQTTTIGPGDTVLAPAGMVHGFVNRDREPARMLYVFPTHRTDRVLTGGN